MIYYPKSHITPNLYSNGDLAYKDTLQPYTGNYFSTFDNKFYTGNYPGDGNNIELVSSQTFPKYPTPESFEDNNPEDSRFYPENSEYSTLKNVRYNKGISRTPTPFYPQPSIADYKTGEFTRYFAKKANEQIFIETSDLVNNKYYIGFSIPWKLTGDKEQVYNVNRNIVELKEFKLKLRGFGDFLKRDYLKFYK